MLKNTIKIFLCFFVFLMNFTFSIKATCENLNIEKELNGYRLVNENGERYILAETGEKMSLFFDTSGNPVTVDDAFNILTNTNENNQTYSEIQTRGPVLPANTAIYKSNTQITGSKRKVGYDVEGPGHAFVAYSISINEGWSASINLTAKIKTIIKAEVEASFTGTYVTSVNTTTTAGAMFDVPSGKTGAVYFSPYYYKHTVSYVDENHNLHTVYYNTPKVNEETGLAEGLLSLVTW